MLKRTINFFDKLEDKTRERLSRHPIIYSIIGGFSIIMFWRAVWESIDILYNLDNKFLHIFFYPPISIIFSIMILLMTGLMVSNFIGHRILISGLKREKKIEEQTEELIKEEEITLKHVMSEIKKLRKDIEGLKK